MTERRQHDRLEVHWPLTYQRLDQDGRLMPPVTQEVLNISGYGIGFRCEEELPPGTVVTVRMEAEWGPSPLFGLARVAWSRPDGNGLICGAQFLWIGWDDQQAQQALFDYVASNCLTT